jgi:hypothetical protein
LSSGAGKALDKIVAGRVAWKTESLPADEVKLNPAIPEKNKDHTFITQPEFFDMLGGSSMRAGVIALRDGKVDVLFPCPTKDGSANTVENLLKKHWCRASENVDESGRVPLATGA